MAVCRDSAVSHIRDQVEALQDGDGPGQRRGHPRLPHQGRQHRHAQSRHHQQRGDVEDDAGAGGLSQLQGQQEPHSPLPQRHPDHRPRHHGDSPSRPRHDWSSGPSGLAGGSPGQWRGIPGDTFLWTIQYCSKIVSSAVEMSRKDMF